MRGKELLILYDQTRKKETMIIDWETGTFSFFKPITPDQEFKFISRQDANTFSNFLKIHIGNTHDATRRTPERSAPPDVYV